MKHILLVALIGVSAHSASARMQPNFYNCVSDSWSLHYSTTSFIGKPTFSLADLKSEGAASIEKKGEQIQIKDGSMGKEIHVSGRFIPDARSTGYTLILPSINLDGMGDSVEFEAMLVETTSYSRIGGPGFIHGPTSKNEFHPLTCTAEIVAF